MAKAQTEQTEVEQSLFERKSLFTNLERKETELNSKLLRWPRTQKNRGSLVFFVQVGVGVPAVVLLWLGGSIGFVIAGTFVWWLIFVAPLVAHGWIIVGE